MTTDVAECFARQLTGLRRGGAIVTSDRSDMEQLGAAARRRLPLIDI